MTDQDLAARLRLGNYSKRTRMQAADRLDALAKERDDAIIKRASWELKAKIQQDRAERLETELRRLRNGVQ